MYKWMSKKRNQKGFTLIELIVVVAILGILAAIAIPRFTNVRTGAEDAAKEATARTVNSAWQVYQAEGGSDGDGTWPGGYLADTTGDEEEVVVGTGSTSVTVSLNGDIWEAE